MTSRLSKAEIQAGLDRWSDRMAGAAQFAKYLEKKERADAARRAQESIRREKATRSNSPIPALGGMRPASSAANPVAAGK